MKCINFVLLCAFGAAALLAVAVVGAPIEDSVSTTENSDLSWLPEGYTITPMIFSGTINGVKVNATGSVQEIFAARAALDPHFTFPEPKAVPVTAARSLEARSKDGINCLAKGDKSSAYVGTLDDGIKHLNSVAGNCGTGPYSCSRISCSYGAGIYVCSRGNYGRSDPCWYYATFAQDIIDKCQWYQFPPNGRRGWVAGGEEFDTNGYSIAVHTDNC